MEHEPENLTQDDRAASLERLRHRARTTRNHARRLASEYVQLLCEQQKLGDARRDDPVGSRALEAELGDLVREYTSVLHALDVPPERVITDVKLMIASSAPQSRRETARLMPRIVRLAIDAYYRG